MSKFIWRFAQVALCAVAFASPGSAQDVNQQGNIQGRFVIVLNPIDRADTFLLDTVTGEVWKQYSFVELNNEPTAWQRMIKIESAADYERLVAVHGKKSPQPQPQTPKPQQ